MIWCPEHPRNNSYYIFEHILIIEKYLGRYLFKNEVVHHKNGIRNDNRIENLEIKTKSQHARDHFMNKLQITYGLAEEITNEIINSNNIEKNNIINIIMKKVNRE